MWSLFQWKQYIRRHLYNFETKIPLPWILSTIPFHVETSQLNCISVSRVGFYVKMRDVKECENKWVLAYFIGKFMFSFFVGIFMLMRWELFSLSQRFAKLNGHSKGEARNLKKGERGDTITINSVWSNSLKLLGTFLKPEL